MIFIENVKKIFGIFRIFSRYLGGKERHLGKMSEISGNTLRRFHVVFVARPNRTLKTTSLPLYFALTPARSQRYTLPHLEPIRVKSGPCFPAV